MPDVMIEVPMRRHWVVPTDVLVGVLLRKLGDHAIVTQADLDAIAGFVVVEGLTADGGLALAIGRPGDKPS